MSDLRSRIIAQHAELLRSVADYNNTANAVANDALAEIQYAVAVALAEQAMALANALAAILRETRAVPVSAPDPRIPQQARK